MSSVVPNEPGISFVAKMGCDCPIFMEKSYGKAMRTKAHVYIKVEQLRGY